jgi:DNA-binding PadR family transcriptional regulator
MRRSTRTGEDPRSPLPLTPVEFHVLLSLADADRHGYAVLQDVARRTDDQFKLRTGTMYTVIKRMLDLSWLQEVAPTASATDERRRYYRLTNAGRDVLRAEARRLQSLVALAHEKRVLAPARRRLAPGRTR